MLREVIQNMACIEGVAGATPDQLEALGGGELLRQEVICLSEDSRGLSYCWSICRREASPTLETNEPLQDCAMLS